MKILFVIPSLTSGGAERALVTMLNNFNYNKYKVDLLILSDDNFYLDQLNNEINILKVPIDVFRMFSPLKKVIFKCIKDRKGKILLDRLRIAIKYRLNKFIGKEIKNYEMWDVQKVSINELQGNYDIAVGYLQGTSIYYVVDKVNANKKIGWIHNDYEKANLNKYYDEKYFDKLDYVFGVSKTITNQLKEIFPKYCNKIKTMYNIVSCDKIINMAQEDAEFDNSFEGIKILTIGRLHPQKGYDLAIDVCKKLVDNNINFKWYIIGKGELRDSIIRKVKNIGIEDRFILLGERKNPYPLLRKCDIYVQPSLYEGFGIVVQEAKILNKPIIVTDCPAMKEQIESGINGIVVKKNTEDIFNELIYLINNKEVRRGFENELSKFDYSSENEMKIFYEIIDEVK